MPHEMLRLLLVSYLLQHERRSHCPWGNCSTRGHVDIGVNVGVEVVAVLNARGAAALPSGLQSVRMCCITSAD